jgi:(E)-4-hydroxy-3-methylbut-2-enyl-diphosphate synthase
MNAFQYCSDPFNYKRFKTREVTVGSLPLGRDNPIRVQTMVNTDTLDTQATVSQCLKCAEVGSDYIRMTVQGIKEANNLINIKKELRARGCNIPLIADVHFNPKLAEIAAHIVEKVRINPGNYIDKKTFKIVEYNEVEYHNELEKIRDRFLPLLSICKENGTALRIGVNHGSLSDRIMSRYGDTPAGMVESAMEFLRICVDENFHQVVLSMKSSNTRIMIQAYRLLVHSMIQEDMNYPLHLGVTEAGEGEDGRIKSAVGIGGLLADGLGDTVRVSLSEAPEKEIPVALKLVNYFSNRQNHKTIQEVPGAAMDPFSFNKQKTELTGFIGGKNQPVVVSDYISSAINEGNAFADLYYINQSTIIEDLPKNFNYLADYVLWAQHKTSDRNVYPLLTPTEYFYGEAGKSKSLNFLLVNNDTFPDELLSMINKDTTVVFVLQTFNTNGIIEQRTFFLRLIKLAITRAVIINRNYCEEEGESLQIKGAADMGPLFADGLGDGIWLRNVGKVKSEHLQSLSFGILQAARVRSTKTEYISCPSCGRTHYNLQNTVARIKAKTSHLNHLKIGIMGCIVNGPGEMADADYGYVGTGKGKITLYKGKEIIQKNIPEEKAVDELIKVIRDHGDWIEKTSSNL